MKIMLSVQAGWEFHIVRSCIQRIMDSPQATPPPALAAFELSSIIPGSIYIESMNSSDVLEAIRDLNGVPSHLCIDFVPLEERSALLGCHSIDIKAGTWARVSLGKYRNDLAYVQTVDRMENEATVLLVPRLSVPQAGKTSRKGNEKRPARPRPHPSLFAPLSGAPCDLLDNGTVEFAGQLFRGGLLEMNISYHWLRLATPTAAPVGGSIVNNTKTLSGLSLCIIQ
jgi:hypothetical protein